MLDGKLSQAKFSRFVLKLGEEFSRWIPGENLSLLKRVNGLIELYDQQPERKLDDGRYLALAIVEKAVELEDNPMTRPWAEEKPEPSALAKSLQLDGFEVENGKLKSQLPLISGNASDEDQVTLLLQKFGFSVTLGHLQQALNAHTRGDWASANGQIRTFMESLFDDLAVSIGTAKPETPSGHQRRLSIAKANPAFFNEKDNEWSDDGKGFFNGVIRRLHSQGSHPGLSDSEDCTFRLCLALLVAHDLLRRLDTR